jgi:hypothetical protein
MGQPADAGDDLERLLKELKAKGWTPTQLRGVRERWEQVCHDPMRRGRGGKGIPQNEPEPEKSDPVRPPTPDLTDLLNGTAEWRGPGVDTQAN